MDALNEIISTVSKSIGGKKSADLRCSDREVNAEALGEGWIAIGEDSSFAHLVAVPKAMPNVVVKVIDSAEDGFYHYAKALYEGDLDGPGFPLIHALTEPDAEGLSVVVMERLTDLDECDREYYRLARAGIRAGEDWYGMEGFAAWYDALWARGTRCQLDLHNGNFMTRVGPSGDRQLVLLDPLGYVDYVETEDA